VLTPTFSKTLKDDFNVETDPTWGPGIYFRCNAERTGIIAIHELPKTKDTILLRLLGKGSVQAEAIKELANLPKDHPYLRETLRHISILQINLKLRHNKTKDIKEVIMNLSPAYEKWHEETIAIGEARGEARGRSLERIAIARTMLQEGAAIALITKVTGFSATEIEQLSLEP
jgi:molybdopterin converting factor small subunit